LSAWLKDYIYIPLGGNRHGTLLTSRNLFLTMLLGGLWHGANWNFVLWGGLHGGGLATGKLWSRCCKGRRTLPASLGWLLTLLFVMVCWVPFRSSSFEDTLLMLKALVGVGAGHYRWLPVWLFWCLGLCLLGHLVGWCNEKRLSAALPENAAIEENLQENRRPVAPVGEAVALGAKAEHRALFRLRDKLFGWLGMEFEAHELSGAWLVPAKVTIAGAYVVAMAVLVILFFAPLDDNPFIYFQF
jgi:MBOAT, membrane-bound O-acyltransferase family